MNIKFETTKVTMTRAFFEMKNGNYTVVMIKTQKNHKPLSFRVGREWYYEEWQLMRMLQFAGGVENTDELEGKNIKVVLNCDNGEKHVVGFGSMTEDKFFLIECQEIMDFTRGEIEVLACENSEYLRQFVI